MKPGDLTYPVLALDVDCGLAFSAQTERRLTLSYMPAPSLRVGTTVIDADLRCFEVRAFLGFQMRGGWRDRIIQFLKAARFADYDLTLTGTLSWREVQDRLIATERRFMEPEADNPDYEDLDPEETPMGQLKAFCVKIEAARTLGEAQDLLQELPRSAPGRGEGRIGRREYWTAWAVSAAWAGIVLATAAIGVGLWAGVQLIAPIGWPAWIVGPLLCFTFLGLLLSAWPAAAAAQRRLQDIGVGGRWVYRGFFAILVGFAFFTGISVLIPAIGWSVGLVGGAVGLGVVPGDPNENRYGPPPPRTMSGAA